MRNPPVAAAMALATAAGDAHDRGLADALGAEGAIGGRDLDDLGLDRRDGVDVGMAYSTKEPVRSWPSSS